MNPRRGMLGYAGAFWALALAAELLGARFHVLALAAAVLVWSTLYWALYTSKRRRFGRARSDRRKQRDAFAAAEALVTSLTLIGAAVGLSAGMAQPHAAGVSLPRFAIGLFLGASGFALLFASSVFDWYWILPRRDGLICEPPCLTSRQPQWRWLTKGWLWNRWFATIAGTLLFVLGAGFFSWGFAPDTQLAGVTGFGSIAGVVAVVVAVLKITPYGEALMSWSGFGPPTLCVGDQITGKTASGTAVDGMLVTIALDQVDVAVPGGESETFSITELWRGALKRSTFVGCSADCCSRVIIDCERRKVVPQSATPAVLYAPRERHASSTRDVFICHASEDKDDVARPLAEALRARGATVWLDEWELRLGDSLRRKVDAGLRDSRFGVVILSPDFFKKEWPQWELDGLATRELNTGLKVVLPVWHQVGVADIAAHSPSLAGKYAARTADGLERVVELIIQALEEVGEPNQRDSSA